MPGKALGVKLVLAACLLGGHAVPSKAQTALEMSVSCRVIAYAPRDAQGTVNFPFNFDTGRCWGGFLSLQQAVRYNDAQGRPMLGVCAPPDSTLTQMAGIFVRYVDGHPAEIGDNWFRLAFRSLLEAFPCPGPPLQPPAAGQEKK